MPAIAEKIVVQFIRKIEETVNDEGSLSEQLVQLIDAIFHVTGEFRDVSALVYAGLSSTEHMNEWEKIYRPLYELTQGLLDQQKKRELIRATVDSNRTAKIVIGLIESAAEQVYLYDAYDAENEKQQKTELLTFLEHALRL